MNDKIYQKQTTIWKTIDTVYYFFYDLEEEELIEFEDRKNSDIMVEYWVRTKEVSIYIKRTKEPIVERVEFLSAPLDYFLDDNIYLPENIKEALIEIRKALLEIKNYVSKE